MAKRKSNSSAIMGAADIGRPYRKPKAYRPATSAQRNAILAAGAFIPGIGGVASRAVRAKTAAQAATKKRPTGSNVRVVSGKRATTRGASNQKPLRKSGAVTLGRPSRSELDRTAITPQGVYVQSNLTGQSSRIASNPRTAERIAAVKRRNPTVTQKYDSAERLAKTTLRRTERHISTQRVYKGPKPATKKGGRPAKNRPPLKKGVQVIKRGWPHD